MSKTKSLVMITLVVVLVAALLVGGACTKSALPEENILKIGMPMPISGPASAWGIPLSNMLFLTADRINAEGGISVNGVTYNVELILADTEFTPEGSAAAAHKLVYDDGVKFIFGPVVGHEILAVQAVTEPEKVIVFCEGWDNEVIKPDKPYTFRFCAAPYEIYPALWSWVTETYPEVKNVFIFNTDTESGWAAGENLVYLLPQMGIEVLDKTYYPYGETDFMANLPQILALNPDSISMEGDPPTMALFCKQARDMGYTGHFFQTDPIDPPIMVDIAGSEYLEGWTTFVDVASEGPMATAAAKELRQAYIDTYGEWNDIAFSGSFAYMLPILKQAIEAAGSLDTEQVHAVLESGMTFDTWLGPIKFGGGEVYGQDHHTLYGGYVGQIQNGKTVIVYSLSVEEELENYRYWPLYGEN
jgi:branched-chain amino acid transport system substrate-binding protein